MANIAQGTKSFLLKCARVWHILRKPDKKEFTTIFKISALAVLAIGLMGFIITIIMNIFG